MTTEEREFLEERVAIAVEHLPEAEAQAVYDFLVSRVAELPSCEIAKLAGIATEDAATAHGSLLTAHTQQ